MSVRCRRRLEVDVMSAWWLSGGILGASGREGGCERRSHHVTGVIVLWTTGCRATTKRERGGDEGGMV